MEQIRPKANKTFVSRNLHIYISLINLISTTSSISTYKLSTSSLTTNSDVITLILNLWIQAIYVISTKRKKYRRHPYIVICFAISSFYNSIQFCQFLYWIHPLPCPILIRMYVIAYRFNSHMQYFSESPTPTHKVFFQFIYFPRHCSRLGKGCAQVDSNI